MSREDILSRLKKSIEDLDKEVAEATAKEVVAAGMDPMDAIQNGLGRGMNTISDLFDEGEMFVPQILMAADAFEAAVDVLTAQMTEEARNETKLGKVIVHTVQGDIHDVGKNIVKTMLRASGFEVIDLGRDVPVDVVVKKAIELGVDIISGSALMTTTMPAQRDIIRTLEEEGVRGRIKCMFGGAPVSQEWVDKIGADAYGENAAEAITKAKELVA
ncbi:MAG: B12-binding domain-containing protein [Thermodesulfovibrionales bacterium]